MKYSYAALCCRTVRSVLSSGGRMRLPKSYIGPHDTGKSLAKSSISAEASAEGLAARIIQIFRIVDGFQIGPAHRRYHSTGRLCAGQKIGQTCFDPALMLE